MVKLLPVPSLCQPTSGREPTALQKNLVEVLVAAEAEDGISLTEAAIQLQILGLIFYVSRDSFINFLR